MAGKRNMRYYSTPMGKICINDLPSLDEKGILMEIQNPSRSGEYSDDNEVQSFKKQALQLANYYFVFQAIIFAGYYNVPSDLKCRYRWIPFVLSFLAGFLNLCALINIACLYVSTLQDETSGSRVEVDHEVMSSPQVYNLPPPLEIRGMSIAETCAIAYRLFYVTVCIGIMVAFFVVTLIGCWTIPCRGSSNPSATTLPPPAS